MEDSVGYSVSASPGPWSFAGTSEPRVPTILIVEDDRDIREMLATLFDLAGFGCVSCDSAEAGLAALRDQPVDFILTDYALPRHTGVWLLDSARQQGLIVNTPVLIMTAHPDPSGASGYEVVHKPFHPDDLIERVKRRLHSDPPRRSRGPAKAGSGKGDGTGPPQCPDPIEVILYVSAHSPRSADAVSKFRRVLARFSSSKLKLTVCDLSTNPEKHTADAVAVASAVIRNTPGPRTFILGHITNPDLLVEILTDCNLEEN